ncbi:MAG: flagellar hook-associated protein FlgL [Nitrospirae bacterium]|nr:flagellar hook-associated protein FlgL [Nitrospirota bacterium]
MAIRIPEFALSESVLFNMASGQRQVATLSTQVASGKRVQSPADDAVAFAKAKNLRGVLAATNQYQENIGHVEDRLGVAETSLGGMQDILTRAKELGLAMANATVSESQRTLMATEAQHLIDELVNLGNTQLNGRYIFSGARSGTPAFGATGSYRGDASVQRVEVGEGILVDANVTGDQVLAGAGGGVDAFALLTQLRDGLGANDQAAIAATLDPLDSAYDQVTRARMTAGLQLSKLDMRRANLEEVAFQTERLLSGQEDVDMASAVSQLVTQQNNLEVSRSVLGRLLAEPTLFSYLR